MTGLCLSKIKGMLFKGKRSSVTKAHMCDNFLKFLVITTVISGNSELKLHEHILMDVKLVDCLRERGSHLREHVCM